MKQCKYKLDGFCYEELDQRSKQHVLKVGSVIAAYLTGGVNVSANEEAYMKGGANLVGIQEAFKSNFLVGTLCH